jgi:FkbM family methyltransferase
MKNNATVKLESRVNSLLNFNDIVLIGGGQLTRMAIQLWPSFIKKPLYVLDTYKSGKIGNIKIKKMKNFSYKENVIYLLCAFKLEVKEVQKIFEQVNQDTILTIYDFFEKHVRGLFSNGWRCLNPTSEKRKKLRNLLKLFCESESKQNLISNMDWRYERILNFNYKLVSEKKKYDLTSFGKRNETYDIVLDVGSYDLSFSEYLHEANVKTKNYIAFEPDAVNFRKCKQNIFKLKKLKPINIKIFNKAVSDDESPSLFHETGTLASRIINKKYRGFNKIKLIKPIILDEHMDKLLSQYPGKILIKMHIEGSELKALNGSLKIISERKPDLFLNLSHDEESLLEIPQKLKLLGYNKLYLTCHALFGEGLTLFACA